MTTLAALFPSVQGEPMLADREEAKAFKTSLSSHQNRCGLTMAKK